MRPGLRAFASLLLFIQSAALAQGPAQITFSEPVEVSVDATTEDILKQSDNYKDGVLTVGEHTFVFDEYGHPVLKQPDQWWWCRWFGLFCTKLKAEPMQLSLDAAKNAVVATIIPDIQAEMQRETGRVLPLIAFAWEMPMPKGTVIAQDDPRNPPMNVFSDSWFFFLDLEPHAYFGHRAEYVLVDGNDGTVTRKRVFMPPVIDGEVAYLNVSERFASKDRFYPEKIEDLPSPGRWPVKFESTRLPLFAPPKGGAVQANAGPGSPSEFLPEGFSVIPTAYADTPTGQDPCVGVTPKKVGVVISGERPDRVTNAGNAEGTDFVIDTYNVKNMMQHNLGFAPGDIHQFNPQSHPNLTDVFNRIRELTRNLGPCDKFFIFVTGHGSPPDKNGNGQPDSPSTDITYRATGVEGKQYISKTRHGDHSLIRLLEEIRAGKINVMIDSCFSGSLQEIVNQHVANPAQGTTWNLFLASPSDEASWSMKDRRGGEYTDAMAYCIRITLVRRGIRNPTIEQLEEAMKECQQKLSQAPGDYGLSATPPTALGVTPMTITLTPSDVSIQEGNSGVKYVEFTVTRTPTDRAITVRWSTYDPDPEGDVSNYANPQDYGWNKNGQDVTFAPGESTKTIRIPINGDTEVEDNETFGVWFPGLSQVRRVTIVDDDRPVASSSSASSYAYSAPDATSRAASSAPSGADGETITITFDTPIKVGPGIGGITIDLGPVTAGGDYVVEWQDEDVSVGKIELKYVDEQPDTSCPPCEEILAELMEAMWQCAELEIALDAANAKLADLERQLREAEKALADAEKKLNDFDNPRSWVESGGRRITSTDLAVTNEFNKQAWQEYKDGDATAQETSDTWGEGPTAEDRERIKEELRDKLQQGVDDARNKLKDFGERIGDLQDAINDLTDELEDCDERVEELLRQLEECEKKCTESEESSESASSEDEDDDEEDDDDDDDDDDDEQESSRPVTQPASSKMSSVGTAVQSSQRSTAASSVAAEQCKGEAMDGDECGETCDGECVRSYLRSNGEPCYRCEIKYEPDCPSGTTPNRYECEEFCGHEGGSCVQDTEGCYSCTVYQCPSGTYEQCPSNCTSGCDQVSEGDKTCYSCKKSCDQVCEEGGYDRVGTDWTGYILEYVSPYTCVSGASAQLQIGTIGSCTCSKQPSITINQTVPVCRATTCGDVLCGQSATCQQGEATVTVNCNFKGWEAVDTNQIAPIIGQ